MARPLASRLFWAYKKLMSIINEPKKPKRVGRPPVESEQLRSRAPMTLVRAVDSWAEKHNMTRAEAIRCLIQIALKADHD
ncbi:MAG: hypothetical protein ABF450_04080, partial [Acetobacter orientalis]